MSSMPGQLQPGSVIADYQLVERLSANVWKTDDNRNRRTVALKVLARSVPRDKARRDAILKELRLGAALHHLGIAMVHAVNIDGDLLYMVSEFVEGEPLSARIRRGLPNRAELLKWTYQITDALGFIHAKGVIHGRLSSDTLIVTPAGDVKMTGFGISSLSGRGSGESSIAEKAADPRAISFRSPEQITGKAVDHKTDFFSLGVVLYEAVTGQLPFTGATPTDVANAVVKQSPAALQVLNPKADNNFALIVGRCLFKEPYQRYANAKLLLDDLRKLEPRIVQLASHKVATAATPQTRTAAEETTLFLAELPYHDMLRAEDPDKALKVESRMQQILGEAVYLFDGEVVDSLGPRMIAIMPDGEKALSAMRKAVDDLAEHNSSRDADGEIVEPKLLLHAGEVERGEGRLSGAAMDLATKILAGMEPMQVLVSQPFLKTIRFTDAPQMVTEFQGVRFYVPPKKPAPPPPPPPVAVPQAPPSVAGRNAGVATDGDAAASESAPRRKPAMLIAAAVAAVLLIGVSVVFTVLRRKETPVAQPVQAQAAAPVMPVPARKSFLVEPFTVDAQGAAAAALGERIRLAIPEMLGTSSAVDVVTQPAPGTIRFGGKIRQGATGLEVVPLSGTQEGLPIAATDAGTAVAGYFNWAAGQLQVPSEKLTSNNMAAVSAYAEALQLARGGDDAKALQKLRPALAADPSFLPAQLLGLELFTRTKNEKEAIEAARRVVELAPTDLRIVKQLTFAEIANGAPSAAVETAARGLKIENDKDLLTVIARYALAAGDDSRFKAALGKLKAVDSAPVVHEPDMLLAAGKIDAAAQRFYDVESQQPDNPSVLLKIGRIAVLRRSPQMAQLQLEKLRKLAPNAYETQMMTAYFHAQERDEAAAEGALAQAERLATWRDDFETSRAEIYAILSGSAKVVAALDRAVARGEATATYILNNPLFRYLENDAGFNNVRQKLETMRGELSTALGAVSL